MDLPLENVAPAVYIKKGNTRRLWQMFLS